MRALRLRRQQLRGISAPDALIDLQAAVGIDVPLDCPPCEGTTTTTTSSTTTTTMGCPPSNGLDGLEFKETYSCAERIGDDPAYCADDNTTITLHFEAQGGGGQYEVTEVPDSGYLKTGTLTCTTFVWSATQPGEYTETGTWVFSADLQSFAGSSTYEGISQDYEGSCNITAAKSPNLPPEPTAVPPCP